MAANRSSEPTYKVTVERHLTMRARDGVALYANVYRPDAPANSRSSWSARRTTRARNWR